MLHARLLQYIDEVARRGSIRAAGARLHVAPSAINRQLIMFEAELGEPLFERLPRGMRPTPAGEVLLAHIRETMQHYRQTVAEVRALQALPTGEVVIATMTGLASSIVAVAATSFLARHPEVHLSIRTMSLSGIHRAVLDGEADLGLGFNLPPSAQLEVSWALDTRLGAVISVQHPLARMESIPLAQCAQFPLVFADRSMVMHGLIAEAFEEAGLEVAPAVTTNSIEAMKRLAAMGDAISFLSRFDIVEEQREGALTFRSIRDRALGENVLTLVRREGQPRNIAPVLVAEEITAALEEAASGGFAPPR